MRKHQLLFEFLCELIDIQIKKYVGLTNIGIGPDAGMNAKLVHDEVEELFSFADDLLSDLEDHHYQCYSVDDELFEDIFFQTKFYFDQEFLRGEAGWLIDENNIHSAEFSRLQKQKRQLIQLAVLADISYSNTFPPITDTQKQCEHDSQEIAFLILNLAMQLKTNPHGNIDVPVPQHAINIMRRHATPGGRYYDETIWDDIRQRHAQCYEYLLNSSLTKSTFKFSKEQADVSAEQHRASFQSMLERYKQIVPDSILFSPEHEWYAVGRRRTPTQPSQTPLTSSSFFNTRMMVGGALVAAGIAMMIYFICRPDEGGAVLTSRM